MSLVLRTTVDNPFEDDSRRHQHRDDEAVRFFAAAADMLCIANADGYFESVNPAWTRTLGYSAAELLSRPYLDLVHPHDRGATIAATARLAAGAGPTMYCNRFQCKHGGYRWLAWTARSAPSGELIYASARDITAAMGRGGRAAQRLRNRRAQEARVRSALDGDAIRVVLQPIVNVHAGAVAGYEALSRFACAPAQPTDAWFADAEAAGLGRELELRAVEEAVATAPRLPAGAFLSINASPATLLQDEFHSLLEGMEPERLVVEVTEHAAVAEYRRFEQAIVRLRARGIRLAVDDAGAGYSGLNQIVHLKPDFIKLDIFLIRDIANDTVKRALAAAMVQFAHQVNATIIAEGVENADTLAVLDDLGVDHAQGYLLGAPQPAGDIAHTALQGISRRPEKGRLNPPVAVTGRRHHPAG